MTWLSQNTTSLVSAFAEGNGLNVSAVAAGTWGNIPSTTAPVSTTTSADATTLVENVTGNVTGNGTVQTIQLDAGAPELLQLDAAYENEVRALMPQIARKLAEEMQQQRRVELLQARALHRETVMGSRTGQHLFTTLLGGQPASDSVSNSVVQAINVGQAATNSTLFWAAWLAANATAEAARLQIMAFDYSSQSSNTLSTFASTITGMVKQVQAFLATLQQYATPAGVQQIETIVQGFIENGVHDMFMAVENAVDNLISNEVFNRLAGEFVNETDLLVHNVSVLLGSEIGKLAQLGLSTDLDAIISHFVGDSNTSATIESLVNADMGTAITSEVENGLDAMLDSAVQSVLAKALTGADDLEAKIAGTTAAPTAAPARASQAAQGQRVGMVGLQLSSCSALSSDECAFQTAEKLTQIPGNFQDSFFKLQSMLTQFTNLLPTAMLALRAANQAVITTHADLDTVFSVFSQKGSGIFDSVAKIYRLIWTAYWVLMTSLNIGILYYAFWASGYFGGPKPIVDDEKEGQEEDRHVQRFLDKVLAFFHHYKHSCAMCMGRFTRSDTCLWSVLVLGQLFVLVIFSISLVLCILAGVQIFVKLGCHQVYILSDPVICLDNLMGLRNFTSSFYVAKPTENIASVCSGQKLLTCELIAQKFTGGTILTVIFSLLAFLFSTQILFDGATMHEQAKCRVEIAELLEDDVVAQLDAGAPSAAIQSG